MSVSKFKEFITEATKGTSAHIEKLYEGTKHHKDLAHYELKPIITKALDKLKEGEKLTIRVEITEGGDGYDAEFDLK
jgi:hypothetical protein